MNENQSGDKIQSKLRLLNETALAEIRAARSEEEIEAVRIKYLSKKGVLTEILRSLKDIAAEMRPAVGAAANDVKLELSDALERGKAELLTKRLRESINAGNFDPTLPPSPRAEGSLHPITIVQRELEEILRGMGFMVVEGPELEIDYYNFEAVNTPENHPARDMQDTYWIDKNLLLRTQTTACQVRAMKTFGVPLRVIAPGRCFRNEDLDASHENTFFQLEGLLIDRGVSIANLIYVMKAMLSEIFKKDVKLRLRPGYFPFVEPGFELDLNCLICGGKGCPTCKNSGWIELVPCGMVHPNVLRYGGVDPDEYTGFAFGLGLTRLVMMKYGIRDIRVLNSGSLRSLAQFGGYTTLMNGGATQ
jgi:phenylalanyl-tRNA synthetase alpha chain